MHRRACSNDLDASDFHCTEIVACAPLALRAGEDRHIAMAVVIEVLYAPLAASVAVLVDGTFGVDAGILDLSARSMRSLSAGSSAATTSVKVRGLAMGFSLGPIRR
jgi:hypothetical protein